ncbi:MAG: iron-siderophore ABC transporter substrate-binding protein, partial [Microcoleus sp. SIO2G3]|nr:iron-siderophore ABC transporter substrate-binding protein [Microcoleus sp. SIO2G3]
MIRSILLASCVILSLVACRSPQSQTSASNASASENCQTVQHQAGETQVCGQPQRIVVLNPKMLDILLSLGVQPIGYAEVFSNRQGNFDRPSQQIPYLGDRIREPIASLGISGTPSLETLSRLKPDLILGDSAGNKEEYAQLSQIAPTLLFEYVGENKWQEPLQTTAKVLDRTEQAEAIIQAYQQELEAARQALAPVVEARPRVLMVASQQVGQTIELVTPADFCGGMTEDLGFQLVLPSGTQAENITQNISLEVLQQLDADLIVVQGYDLARLSQIQDTSKFEDDQLQAVRQTWNTNSITRSLKATQEDRVFFLSTYLCRGLPSPIGAQLILK